MIKNSRTPKKIRHHLKHFFIPHVHNDYKPHIFRETSVSILLSTTLFLFGLSVGSAYIIQGTEVGKSIISKVLIDLTNKNRKENNLLPLSENPKLYDASLLKAKDMLGNQYFAHESPAGLTPWHFLEMVNYEYTYAGENLAINHTDNDQTETAWMNSPLHRKNILDSNFEEIGISAYTGDYNGKNTIFVVQMFGTPAEEHNTLTMATENTKKEEVVKDDTTVIKKDIVKVATKEVLSKTPETKEENSIIKTTPDLENISSSTISTATNTFAATLNASTNTVALSVSSSPSLKVEGVANKNYSKIYERLIYNGSNYVQNMLQILFVIIFIATLTDVLIEIKRQHLRHIAYAVLLLIILVTLMYINKNYFEINLKVLF